MGLDAMIFVFRMLSLKPAFSLFLSLLFPLLFNMLSRLVITFLQRNKHVLISWLQSPSAVILETNLDNILKSRGITLPTKVHLVKAMVFPVVMYGCESWTVKKAEHRIIDAF